MSVPLADCNKLLVDLGKLAADLASVIKSGLGVGEIPKVFAILMDLRNVVADAQVALPELRSLNSADGEALATKAYSIAEGIVASLIK